MKALIAISFTIIFITGCASSPKLYPNETYKKNPQAAQAAIDMCMSDAETYLKSSKGKQITKGAGAGAIIGGAMGAVSGLFTGNVARGAAQGAAVGGAGGAAGGAISPDQLKRNYVNQCLGEKGYRVL
ncbi:MAG: hypothetical protein KDD38_07030, partial [Bdellovibrionales bacterium]|nr:hypothetical protein [Bdellovibrionales bacterium]